ncbi:MAG: uroporphyrinogen-III synthase [Xanthobacteraceae bacterium]
MRLLLTRPEADAERTAAALRIRGHTVAIASLLRIEPLPDAEIGAGPWAAILVTSANAARAIAAHKRLAELQALPVLAVGERSAQAMRAVGFADVSSAEGAASDLTRLAAERLKRGAPLLHLAGADRSGDIAADLAAQNFLVRTAVVYRAVPANVVPPAATEALADAIDGVLHFSRRSAETYVNLTRHAGLAEPALKKPAHFCLSAQVAEPLAQAGAVDIRIAREPTEAGVLALVPATAAG